MTKIPLPDFLPTVSEIRDAATRIASAAKRTRLLRSDALSSAVHTDVYLKCELEQETGSFKVRGAFNVLASSRQTNANVASLHQVPATTTRRCFCIPCV